MRSHIAITKYTFWFETTIYSDMFCAPQKRDLGVCFSANLKVHRDFKQTIFISDRRARVQHMRHTDFRPLGV